MRLHLSAALWEQQQWYKVNWSGCRCQGTKDGDIHFELKDTTGINPGIFWRKYPLDVRGAGFGKSFSARLRKERGSTASMPLSAHVAETAGVRGV